MQPVGHSPGHWFRRWFVFAGIWLVALAATLGLGSVAHAQVVPHKPKPFVCQTGCPPNPVTFTFSTNSGTVLTPTLSEHIEVCATPAAPGDTVWYNNGTPMTNFTADTTDGCEQLTTPAETLLAGQNTFTVNGCSGFLAGWTPQCLKTSVTITHPAIAVTPKNSPVTVTTRTSGSQTFTVNNYMGVSKTDSLKLTCTGIGIVGCSAPATVVVPASSSSNVTVTYSVTDTLGATGLIQLKGTMIGGGGNPSTVDSGSYAYTVKVVLSP